jgi:hypothetical protein
MSETKALDRILEFAVRARRAKITEKIVSSIGHKVQDGPFSGMILPDRASWGTGDVAAKILGCYEAELHASLEDAIKRQPEVVVNIGCAEGYYTVGLARRLPKAKVYAFDIDAKARKLCMIAANENGVSQRAVVGGECHSGKLAELAGQGTRALVVMDCEGAELKLLDATTVGRLSNCDLIVECHDFIDRSVTPGLLRLFKSEHNVEIVREGARNPSLYPILQSLNSTDRWISICEFRPEVMSWLIAWAH